MPTIADRLRSEGKIEEKRETLIRQLDLKYGLTDNERDRIRRTVNSKKLDKALDLVITADSKDAVLEALE